MPQKKRNNNSQSGSESAPHKVKRAGKFSFPIICKSDATNRQQQFCYNNAHAKEFLASSTTTVDRFPTVYIIHAHSSNWCVIDDRAVCM